MVIVVSDTSPVRALAQLDNLELLRDLFGQVLVPPAVEKELLHPPSRLMAVDVGQLAFVEVRAPRDHDQVNRLLETLDPGESEAIALAVEVTGSAVLMDERAGRSAAAQLGLPVIGTLGLLLRSKEKGFIPTIGPLVDRLQNELGFFVSAELRAEVLRRAGE